MAVKTFLARVIGGRLQFQESLEEFEGQRVEIRITTVETAAVPSARSANDAESTGTPEWLNVERDIYIKMPRRIEVLRDIVVVEGGPIRPCIILPEELPDD